jgi:hypothetical protein
MYDYTNFEYAPGQYINLGWRTVMPNQDPVTLLMLPNVKIPYGAVCTAFTNTVDTGNVTIYSTNSVATYNMWTSIDGSGPYDATTNPNGSDIWIDLLPPATF